jgi:uncharacterized repeat protein (TIGR01451 family)
MNNPGIGMLGLALALAIGQATASFAHAQEAPGTLQITNAVFQEVEAKAPDGKITRKVVPAGKVVPGGEVIYEIAYRNTGKQTATDINIDNPLPAEVVFVEAATAPTVVSVDGGKHYGKLSELTVPGAQGQVRAARNSDITDLRWIVPSLAPGASGKVTYRARVK